MARKEFIPPPASAPPPPASPGWLRGFVWGLFVVAAAFALWAVSLMGNRESEITRYATQGWDKAQILNTGLTFDTRLALEGFGASGSEARPVSEAEVIVANKIRSLWHAAFMALCAAGFCWLFVCARPKKKLVYACAQWGLVLLVMGDAWLLSRFYVKTMPLAALDENAVITLLKQDMPEHRVALVSQDGFYNWWLTFVFPYHGIQTVNFTQMPRMPADYKIFMDSVGRNPLRYWQLAAVGYVLAPVQVWQQLQRDPVAGALFELRLAYNVSPGVEGMGVTVQPALSAQSAQHVVLRFKQPGPHYALLAGAEVCDDATTLRRLADPTVEPFQQICLAPEDAALASPLNGQGTLGQVERLGYRSGFSHLKTTCAQPALLRISEKFDPDWKVWLDGQPAPLRRVDYIFQGVFIPAGTHDVVLKYAPACGTLYVQLSGVCIFFLAALWLLAQKIRSRFKPQPVAVPTV